MFKVLVTAFLVAGLSLGLAAEVQPTLQLDPELSGLGQQQDINRDMDIDRDIDRDFDWKNRCDTCHTFFNIVKNHVERRGSYDRYTLKRVIKDTCFNRSDNLGSLRQICNRVEDKLEYLVDTLKRSGGGRVERTACNVLHMCNNFDA